MPRSLLDRLKIPGCRPEAESHESVTQSQRQLPDNQLQGPGESWIKTVNFTPTSNLLLQRWLLIGFMATVLIASILFSFPANRVNPTTLATCLARIFPRLAPAADFPAFANRFMFSQLTTGYPVLLHGVIIYLLRLTACGYNGFGFTSVIRKPSTREHSESQLSAEAPLFYKSDNTSVNFSSFAFIYGESLSRDSQSWQPLHTYLSFHCNPPQKLNTFISTFWRVSKNYMFNTNHCNNNNKN